MPAQTSYNLAPYEYIHVKDKNLNITRVVRGPRTFIPEEQESVLHKTPQPFIYLGKRQYCVIKNPVVVGDDGKLVLDKYGQVKNQHGEKEYRFYKNYSEPFPLYPGEDKDGDLEDLKIIREGAAFRIRAIRDLETESGENLSAGDEWLVSGLCTYYPRVEEEFVEIVNSSVIGRGEALRLKASQEFTDRFGVNRKSGEEYLCREFGRYLPDVYETVVEMVKATPLTESRSMILTATQSFTDVYGVDRKAGEEWMVSNMDSSSHILDVNEEIVKEQKRIILTSTHFCVIMDPWDQERRANSKGNKVVRRGEASFFLQPGEYLENGIENIHVLSEQDAVLVKAKEKFVFKQIQEPVRYEAIMALWKAKKFDDLTLSRNNKNGSTRAILKSEVAGLRNYESAVSANVAELGQYVEDIEKAPGDKWMIYGPMNYVPPVAVEYIQTVKEIPLDKNEGVYVRDIKTGNVRAVIGETYMLKAHEEFSEINLSEKVVQLLQKDAGSIIDLTKVISYKIPYNSAVQVYDYNKKTSRVVFGPDLVMLSPEETITVHSLSGGKPKKANLIQCLWIGLGPDFTSDLIEVETSDHARLQLLLSYNWHFSLDKTQKESADKIFSTKDFIGNMCSLMAAKIRSEVAKQTFDTFHKGSAKIIRTSMFGLNEEGKVNDEFVIRENNMVITNVDIQSIVPMDNKTKGALKNTVALAIEITTKKQKEEARIISDKKNQESQAQINSLKIEHEVKIENAKTEYLKLSAECTGILDSGKANAEAKAKAEANKLIAHSKVIMSRLDADEKDIQSTSSNERENKTYRIKVDAEKAMNELLLTNQATQSDIESKKFEDIIEAVGTSTLMAISNGTLANQAAMLGGLGLKGYLLTDGKTPVNLFSAAQGMLGNPNMKK